jgi:UDP-GlcNAc3NAcA epimerase
MKVVSVVGARPEFIQAAPLTRALRPKHQEILVHTGQHYDYRMSQVFFQDLAIPEPDYNLGAGSGGHGQQTGAMLGSVEDVLVRERPDWVIVRGDTNSTLAGALAAAKLHIPVAHVEVGARSFERAMPEEVNRVVVDHLSDRCFCILPSALDNLAAEGIIAGVHYVGDVMLDSVQHSLGQVEQRTALLDDLGLRPAAYVLATVHRAANTDDPGTLGRIVTALNGIGEPVILPLHPRTRKALDALAAPFAPHVRVIEPVGYLDMLVLERNARLVVTDSGGVTREAYFLGVPCVTLRNETEHVETVTHGWNTLAGADPERIIAAVRDFRPAEQRPPVFGDGAAARRIVDLLAGIESSTAAPAATVAPCAAAAATG